MTPAPDFDALGAPRDDAGVLIAPAVTAWRELIDHNRALRRGYAFEIAGRSYQACEAAHNDPPVVLIGHQPEFMHAGVWAKNAIGARAAAAFGGRAAFILVDNDVPDRAVLRFPLASNDGLTVGQLSDLWTGVEKTFEQQVRRDDATWRSLFSKFPTDLRNDQSRGIGAFLTAFVSPPLTTLDDGASDYCRRFAAGLTAFDAWLGVPTPELGRVGRLSRLVHVADVSWGQFVRHIALNAARFAQDYNAALADYRTARGVHGTRHPIPDLAITDDRVELPLWAWRGREPRARVHAARRRDPAMLLAGEREIGSVQAADAVTADGGLGEFVVRPRALLLTLYARLFLCDLFIHGLGGAKYDIITDNLMRRFYGIEPPRYACVTATLRLPFAVRPDAPQTIDALRRVRDARWNPQRMLDPALLAAHSTVANDRAMAITESERLRRERPEQHAARRRIFNHIRAANDRLRAADPAIDDRTHRALAASRVADTQRAIIDSREWFVALHPRDRLEALLAKLEVG